MLARAIMPVLAVMVIPCVIKYSKTWAYDKILHVFLSSNHESQLTCLWKAISLSRIHEIKLTDPSCPMYS